MFAYCLNNPVCRKDDCGAYSIMACDDQGDLCSIIVNPVGYGSSGGGGVADATSVCICVGGSLILGGAALANGRDLIDDTLHSEAEIIDTSSCVNNSDDDDGEFDDINFGGRQKIGKQRGNAPGNNKAQNKQFRDATKGLSPKQQRMVHDRITKKGLGYHEIKAIIDELFVYVIGFCMCDEWSE